MLPLRSVGRSNFDMAMHILRTLIKKRYILMRTAVYIYTMYIYIYIYGIAIFHMCMPLFESTLLSFCKTQSKLEQKKLRWGSRERKNATEQTENMILARI